MEQNLGGIPSASSAYDLGDIPPYPPDEELSYLRNSTDHFVRVHCPDGMSKHDIGVEKWRTYHYENRSTFTVEEPMILFLKRDHRGDSHRVVTKKNRTIYPRRGWIAIEWENHEGNEPVQF